MPAPETPSVKALTLAAPFRWLRLGAGDLWRNPLPGLMHGFLLAVFGAVLLAVAHDQFWWLAGAFSGFLIVAPVLATGLYAVSRAAEREQTVSISEVLAIWASQDTRLVSFGLLLGLAGTGWVLTSAGLITLWAEAPVQKPEDFLRNVVLQPDMGLFEVWLLLGTLLVAPVFASSVITLPMLVDQPVGLWSAVKRSWQVVADQPTAMALWALLIVLLVGLGFATFLVGLVVLVPWLGHASWHAYRELVPEPSSAKPRPPGA
jgi:uncharacterized membrane protein